MIPMRRLKLLVAIRSEIDRELSLAVSGGTGISAVIRKYNPYIPLIGMTAYSIDWVLKQNGGSGVDHWLMKPFSRHELETAVWTLMTKLASA